MSKRIGVCHFRKTAFVRIAAIYRAKQSYVGRDAGEVQAKIPGSRLIPTVLLEANNGVLKCGR